MNQPPTQATEVRSSRDNDHLHILAVCEFIIGGLGLLGSLVFLGLFFMMLYFAAHPEMMKGKDGSAPPTVIFDFIAWVYLAIGIFTVISAVANIFSGFFLLKKRHRVFCLIVAGLNCLHVPLGTALGVFTFIVLLRDSVRQAYLDAAA